MNLLRRSILLRLCVSMTLLLAAVFLVTGRLLSRSISTYVAQSIEEEIAGSFRAYEALWRLHSEQLNQLSNVVSLLPDVRAALSTEDEATIQDTAGEVWQKVSSRDSLFAVATAEGKVLASIGQGPFLRSGNQPKFLKGAGSQTKQKAGFFLESGRLFQLSVTPVYVDAQNGKALLNLLVTGFKIDQDFLQSLKQAASGSDFVFQVNGQAAASTLPNNAELNALSHSCSQLPLQTLTRIEFQKAGYLALNRTLPTLSEGQQANLCLIRSLSSSETALQALIRQISRVWLAGFLVALLAIYLIVRRMLQPIADLDQAASSIAAGNYGRQIPDPGNDELGRLARSFNSMSVSLEETRRELIRSERLTAVSRLATFVVHDLRNPLASIYAGAEMLVDNDLPDTQIKRLAGNMYQASRGVITILNNLIATARNTSSEPEACVLHEMVAEAWAGLNARACRPDVHLDLRLGETLEVRINRAAVERILHNLMENALQAIEHERNGCIMVDGERQPDCVLLHVRDNGRGVHPDLRPNLFQPFASQGREGGLGLGLALSKEAAQANGGDLWADFGEPTGSHFVLRLPLVSRS